MVDGLTVVEAAGVARLRHRRRPAHGLSALGQVVSGCHA
jgi:hypothetical protein